MSSKKSPMPKPNSNGKEYKKQAPIPDASTPTLESKKRQPKLFKSVFVSPYDSELNPITKEQSTTVMQHFAAVFKDFSPRNVGTHKKESTAEKPAKFVAIEGKDDHEPPSKKRKITDNVSVPPSDKPLLKDIMNEVVLGINQVTRRLAKTDPSIPADSDIVCIFLCQKLDPFRIAQHIPVECQKKKIPLCLLPEESSTLGKYISSGNASDIERWNGRTVTAIGFLRPSLSHPAFGTMLETFSSLNIWTCPLNQSPLEESQGLLPLQAKSIKGKETVFHKVPIQSIK